MNSLYVIKYPRPFKIVSEIISVNNSWYWNSRFYSSHQETFKPKSQCVVSNFCYAKRSYSYCSKSFGYDKAILTNKVNLIGSLSEQKRYLSFQDSFDSAIVTHTALFNWLSESAVVENTKHLIVQFHDTTGLPWWLSIIVSTVIVRTVLTFPVALYQHYVIARLENVKMEMEDIVNSIKYELNRDVRKNKWSERKAQQHYRMAVKKEWNRLVVRDNCHPAKTAILAIIQIPLWVILSTAIRNLVYKVPYNDPASHLRYLELVVGGVAWFPNLTVSDSFIIPITLGLSNLAIIEVQTMMYKGKKTKLHKYLTYFFRGFTIFMIPVASNLPSCLTLYWVTSSLCGLCQNLSLLSPRLRRLVGIPITHTTHDHPYRHLSEQIINKFRQ